MTTMRTLIEAAERKAPYKVGQWFTFKVGDKVICNGYPGVVERVIKGRKSVEVRLASGVVEVSSAYPECYPADGRVEEAFGGRGRGGDPYLMKAKYAGVDANGTPFKKGEEVLYYPNGKRIFAGAAKDKAWREFQAARDDEAFMGGGY